MKAAEETFKKDKRINIRISSRDLEALQRRALEEGLPLPSALNFYISHLHSILYMLHLSCILYKKGGEDHESHKFL